MRRKREDEGEKEKDWGDDLALSGAADEFGRERKRHFAGKDDDLMGGEEDDASKSVIEGDSEKPKPERRVFTEEEDKTRFCMELEFIQTLSNPEYLYSLAQRRLFQDKAFINYLKYLLYWRKPEYAKYIVYPHCLRFLEMLQSEHFRNQLNDRKCIEFIHGQQFYHWQYYKQNRYKEAIEGQMPQLQQPEQPQPSHPPQQNGIHPPSGGGITTDASVPVHIERIVS